MGQYTQEAIDDAAEIEKSLKTMPPSSRDEFLKLIMRLSPAARYDVVKIFRKMKCENKNAV